MRARSRRERGGNLIEFSIAASAVLTVIFAVMEVGRLMMSYVTIAEAARAGVRYAIVNGIDTGGTVLTKTAAVQGVVQAVGTAAGLSLSAPTVNFTACAACTTGQDVGSTVTVTQAYTFAPVGIVSALGVTLTTTSQGVICY
jgi:Flp pilus assembly protein TadG